MAAYYPDNPTEEHQKFSKEFLQSFGQLFPCRDCGDDLLDFMEENRPQVKNRKEFSIWMCNAHNHVNERLSKPAFDCSLPNLDKRWRVQSEQSAKKRN